MARFPCAVGPHRNRGRNYTAYVHTWGPGSPTDSRVRLCAEHVGLIQHDLAQFEIDPDSGAPRWDGAYTHCLACRNPVSEIDWHASVTSYEPDDQSKDYGARLHVDCSLPEWMTCGEPTK